MEAPEVLIVAKLSVYYSDQSLRDVILILGVSMDEIDFDLLRRIAERVGVRRRLEEVLKVMKGSLI